MLEQQHVSRKLNFDSTGDVRRSPITAIPGSSNTCECSDAWFVLAPQELQIITFICVNLKSLNVGGIGVL